MPDLLIIGAGAIARRHAAANRVLPGGPRTLTVADPDPAARAAFLADIPEAILVDDPLVALARPGADDDIAVIATPPTTHRALAEAALRGGRHVLCEKPMALSVADADALAALASRQGRLLHECSNRFLGFRSTDEARRLVASGALGRVYRARWIHTTARGRPGIEYQPRSAWFLDRARAGGGVGFDWSVYDLAVLLDVLGAVEVVISGAFSTTPALPPGVTCDVEHHLGAQLAVTTARGDVVQVAYERASACQGVERAEAEILGATGGVTWQWLTWPGDRMWLEHRRDHDGILAVERREWPVCAEQDCHHRPLHGLVAAVAGRSAPVVDGTRAAHILAVVLAILASADDGQARTIRL